MTASYRPIPRALYRRSTARSLLGAARIWLTIAAVWAVAVYNWNFAVLAVAAVLIGTMQYHLNVLGHDGIHYLLSADRGVNEFLCRWVLHGPHGAPLAAMRRNHLHHHAKLGDESDLDRQYYDISRFRSGTQFATWLAGSCVGGMSLPVVAKLLQRMAARTSTANPTTRAATSLADVLSVIVSQAWIFALLYWWSGHWYAYVVLWILPLFSVMMGLNVIRSCLEHADDTGLKDPPRSYSFVSGPVERFFVSPFNMNIHAEHHLSPAVPWFSLPEFREFLRHSGQYEGVRLCSSYAQRYSELRIFLDRRAAANPEASN